MDIIELEEKLRLKITQAEKNGFTVVPLMEAIDLDNQQCCLLVAYNDLKCYPMLDFSGPLTAGFEQWHNGECYHEEKNRLFYRLGAKLRRECLAKLKRRESGQGRE